jgi:hypothetical protein
MTEQFVQSAFDVLDDDALTEVILAMDGEDVLNLCKTLKTRCGDLRWNQIIREKFGLNVMSSTYNSFKSIVNRNATFSYFLRGSDDFAPDNFVLEPPVRVRYDPADYLNGEGLHVTLMHPVESEIVQYVLIVVNVEHFIDEGITVFNHFDDLLQYLREEIIMAAHLQSGENPDMNKLDAILESMNLDPMPDFFDDWNENFDLVKRVMVEYTDIPTIEQLRELLRNEQGQIDIYEVYSVVKVVLGRDD